MTTATDESAASFAYRAQTIEGAAISGTIDASGVEEARKRLESLRLRVLEIGPALREARSRPIRGDDFIAFNQQLAHLTAAGLPMEHGLRLIAEDMRSGRLAGTIRSIAQELEAGRPLGEVFNRYRGQFPSMYGQLLEAGVRSNNLAGMLFGLSRHMELTRRLSGMLWRVAAYPLMVLVGLSVVLMFLAVGVVPKFEAIFNDFKVPLPDITLFMIWMSEVLPPFVGGVLVLALASPLLGWIAARLGWDGKLRDWLVLPLPLIGPVVKKSLLATWCDAARLAVEAGLELPAAIELAGNTSASPRLQQDGRELMEWLSAGNTLNQAVPGKILPATVLAAMSLGIEQHDLPAVLRNLSEMYQQQADMRMNAIPGILTPILLLIVAGVIGMLVVAMFMPLISIIGAVSGSPGKK